MVFHSRASFVVTRWPPGDYVDPCACSASQIWKHLVGIQDRMDQMYPSVRKFHPTGHIYIYMYINYIYIYIYLIECRFYILYVLLSNI